MSKDIIHEEVIKRYLNGTCSPEEKALVETWHLEGFRNSKEIISIQEIQDTHENMRNTIIAHSQPTIKKLWPRIAAAASIILVLSAGGYFLLKKDHSLQVAVNQPVKNDVQPGKNTATLILANGNKVILANATNGQIAKQAGVTITKTANGQLVYNIARTDQTTANQFNTLSTAKGETYKVNLPDGTQVWLNAASTLTYPARFIGSERKVTLTGEGYFEVAKDKTHPFLVASDKQVIKVLGTHFNVNTYSDEPAVKTTLLEGIVQIKSFDGQIIKMKPGQQVSMTGNTFNTVYVDTEDAVAWTKGQLQFNDKTVPEIMRQIAKWYDVQVIFDSEIPEVEWTGSISRHRPLSQVLRMLEKSNEVKFRIEGKKLYVRKYIDPNN